MYKLISFDLFDTLITRATATPLGIFAIIEKTLKTDNQYKNLPQYLRNNFFTVRVHTEKHLREAISTTKKQEITLEEIYKNIAHNLAIKNIDSLLQLEVNTELANLLPISTNIAKIKQYSQEGKRVIIISDTYFNIETIKRFLAKLAPELEAIKIYSSAEVFLTKNHGDLYKFIAKTEEVDFKEWLHIGDNKHSDIKMAQSFEIQTEYYCASHLIECEKHALKNNENNLFMQLAIGTAKNVRVNNYQQGDYFKLGASIGAPLCFVYVYWLLEQALKEGIEFLYFVARDGYVLKQIADLIIKTKKYNIQTRYLYISRKSVRLPSLYINKNLAETAWLYSSFEYQSLQQYIDFFNFDTTEFLQFWPVKKVNINAKLNKKQRLLLKALLQNKQFISQLQQKAKPLYTNLVAYLQQEINFNQKLAFVELRGTGVTQNCLNQVIKAANQQEPFSFFYGVDPTKNQKTPLYTNYYCMFASNTNFYHNIIEALTRAPHGEVLTYGKDSSNKIIAKLNDSEGRELQKITNYFKGVVAFSESYLQAINAFSLQPLDLKQSLLYGDFLLNHPDSWCARTIGSIPFDIDNKGKIIEYAPKLKLSDLYKLKKPNWPAGLKARNTDNFLIKFYLTKIYQKNIRKKLFHIYISKKKRCCYWQVIGIKVDFSKLLFR